MTTGPVRRVQPEEAAPPPRPRTPAAAFGRRMWDFADLFLGAGKHRDRFANLMETIAEDYRGMTDAQYYDRVKAATDLLPMTKDQGLHFAERIKAHLDDILGEK